MLHCKLFKTIETEEIIGVKRVHDVFMSVLIPRGEIKFGLAVFQLPFSLEPRL